MRPAYKTPDPGRQRDELARLARESTDKNRQFFVLYLGMLSYLLLMVFATSDRMLLVPTRGIRLPLMDVTIPLLSFYWIAPLLLLAIHFNLLQNLENHHYKLMRWRDACNGRVPRRQIPAFLFDYAWLDESSTMRGWVRFGNRFLLLNSGPFALGVVLWRFSDYQSLAITSWHLLVFILDSYLVWMVERAFQANLLADRTKSREAAPLAAWQQRWRMRYRLLKVQLASFLRHLLRTAWQRLFGVLVLLQYAFVLAVTLSDHLYPSLNSPLPSWFIPSIRIDPNEPAWLPDKQEIELQAFLSNHEEKTGLWWQKQGKGLDLRGRHLRGISAPRVVLPRLILDEHSDLQGADLAGAHLQGAHLARARLQDADLSEAQLQWADFTEAHLQGVNFNAAMLQEAVFNGAYAQGSNFSAAELQGAIFGSTQLQAARFNDAQLQGATLASSQLQAADFNGAQLQGSSLYNAGLQGADFSDAQLQGAILYRTAFQRTRLPAKTEVAYNQTPQYPALLLQDSAWATLSPLAVHLISDEVQGEYLQRLQQAQQQAPNHPAQLAASLLDRPEVLWRKVIPQWDRDPHWKLDTLLVAAGGIKKRYSGFFANEKRPEQNQHPDYVEKLNQAFCRSKRLQSLCEPPLPP